MNRCLKYLTLVMGLLLLSQAVQAARIVVTIPPLLSAIKPLLTPEDQVTVLLTRGQSPHGFTMKPSHAMALQKADIIVSVGSGVDQWAQKTIHNVQQRQGTAVINMVDLPNITVIEGHHEEHGEEHDHAEHHDEDLMRINPHLWLDMGNIEKLVSAFGKSLEQQDPVHASEIATKTQNWLKELQITDDDIKRELKSVKQVPYLVFHNAFVYFEKRYGLNNQGALHNSAEQRAGVKRLAEVDDMIQSKQIKCVFQEPQLSGKQLKGLIKDSQVRLGTLDPLGDGSLNTAQFMQNLAHQYVHCLAGRNDE